MRDVIDLDAIEARAAAATPGPWDADADGCEIVQSARRFGAFSARIIVADYDDPGYLTATDRAFIVAAREDVPALCREVRRLRAEVARLRDEATDA